MSDSGGNQDFSKRGRGWWWLIPLKASMIGCRSIPSINPRPTSRSILDRDSVNTQSTLHQHRGRQSFECPPTHISEILRISARPPTCYRQSTSGPNGDRYADRFSIEYRSRVNRQYRSTLDRGCL